MAKAKADGGEKAMSKTDMVRAALEELGMDAQPLDVQVYIQSKFDEELATQTISNYKFQIRKKAGKAGPGRGRRAAPAAASPTGGSLRVEDFELLRILVDRLGVDQVKKMVDVVG